MSFQKQIERMNQEMQEYFGKLKPLKEMELFVLDNSLSESTVAQLRGHTVENKWKIYGEVKRTGFQHMIVASFSHMIRVDDAFCRELKKRGEDFNKLYAFTELVDPGYKNRVPDVQPIPVGLKKMKEFGINNPIIEVDFVYSGIDYEKFTIDDINTLLSERMGWVRENLSKESRILINLRDFPAAMSRKPERIFQTIHYLSSLPQTERPFGLIYEDPSGNSMPQQLGAWTAAIRREMDGCDFKNAKLLVHVHEQWGMADSSVLECLANGADGIWASLCEEGAAMGHSCSSVIIMNLVRLGNKKVLQQFNCTYLRKAARKITRITTGLEAGHRQVVYGERALDLVSGLPNVPKDKNDFDIAAFFDEKPPLRMTTLASPEMIAENLRRTFGEDPQFTEERGKKMKEVMLEDLNENRKEEYMSAVGLATLFERSGGQRTSAMRDAIGQNQPRKSHVQHLIGFDTPRVYPRTSSVCNLF